METVNDIFLFLGVVYLLEQALLLRFAYKNRGFLIGQSAALYGVQKILFGKQLTAFEAKEIAQLCTNIVSSDTQNPTNTYDYITASLLAEVQESEDYFEEFCTDEEYDGNF